MAGICLAVVPNDPKPKKGPDSLQRSWTRHPSARGSDRRGREAESDNMGIRRVRCRDGGNHADLAGLLRTCSEEQVMALNLNPNTISRQGKHLCISLLPDK